MNFIETLYFRFEESTPMLKWTILKGILYQGLALGMRHLRVIGPAPQARKLLPKLIDLNTPKKFDLRVDLPIKHLTLGDVVYCVSNKLETVIHLATDFTDVGELSQFQNYAPNVIVYLTINRFNYPFWYTLIKKLLLNIGFKTIAVTAVIGGHFGPEEYITFCKHLCSAAKYYPGRIYARIPWSMLELDVWTMGRTVCNFRQACGLWVDGTVMPCGVERRKYSKLPNIQNATLKEILSTDPQMIKFRQLKKEGLNGVCNCCIFRKYCANQCPAYVYNATGSFTNSFPECQILWEAGLFPNKYMVVKE
ncbi:MAG: hypothetical protein DDT22_00824 [candidate division WS2 bacterium]|nr:hypothetical protein [Candidatus Lithacetigena glycinireducens]